MLDRNEIGKRRAMIQRGFENGGGCGRVVRRVRTDLVGAGRVAGCGDGTIAGRRGAQEAGWGCSAMGGLGRVGLRSAEAGPPCAAA